MSEDILPEQKISVGSAVRFAPRTRNLLLMAVLILPVVGIYFARLNEVFGQAGDDAWYVLLAQSLATGKGFQLINWPTLSLLPSYPPAFPFLLSLWLRWTPLAAENFWLLKWVSVAAMLGVGIVTFYYATRICLLPQLMAMLVSMAVVLMPAFVFLATSTLMSECVFTLVQLLTVMSVEKNLRREQQVTGWWVLSALLGAATFLIRSIAIGGLVAIVLYLVKERRFKAAILFAGTTAVLIAPWVAYTRANATTKELKQTHGGNIVYTYGDQVWMKRAGIRSSGTVTIADLPARVWENSFNIAARDFCGIFFPSFLRSSQESGEEAFSLGKSDTLGGGGMAGATTTATISITLFLLALLGFVVALRRQITLAEILLPCSLGIVLLWPWWTFRFVIPLAPFLFHYLLIGIATLANGAQKLLRRTTASDPWVLPRLVLLCVLALYGYDHFSYINAQTRDVESSAWVSEYNESAAVLAWMRTHLSPDAIVASSSPARVFLHCGYKALSCDQPLENWETWKRLDVRYLVILTSRGSTVLDGQEKEFPVLYRSPNDMRVIDLGPPAQRAMPKH